MSRKLALIIGNSEYEDTNLSRLVTPAADVGALAGVIRDPEIGGFEVATLINQPATMIRREIARFFRGKGRDDLLLLYFSGHGVRDDRGHLYLAVKDTERDLLSATAIPATFITDEMDRSRSRRQVLILDCCHSGAFAGGAKGAPGAGVCTAAAFQGTGYGRVVLTATDSTQYAWEGDQVIGEAEHSVFTHHLIQGLRTGEADADADGWITLDEWYDYVYRGVVSETPRQTPGKWSYKEQGEIVIARNPRPVVRPVELPPELRQAIESPLAGVREGTVRELDTLLRGSNKGLAMSAQAALERLADDDSRRVSAAAAESLAAHTEAQRPEEWAKAEVKRERREKPEALYERALAAVKSLPWAGPVIAGTGLIVVLLGITLIVKPWRWVWMPAPAIVAEATATATVAEVLPLPTGTPSPWPTWTPTDTATRTPSPWPTWTPTDTATGTPSPWPTWTPTGTATGTPSPWPTWTPTGTATGTPSPWPTPTPTRTAAPTRTPTRLVAAPETILIPAGPFLMGSTEDDEPAYDGERPQHPVELDAFHIGRYPVTNAEYARFIEEGGYENPTFWTEAGWAWQDGGDIIQPAYWEDPQWNQPDHPVVGVAWYEALAYCRWLSEATGQAFRLPSEAEWEKAARGEHAREWPWGDDFGPEKCNTLEGGPGRTTAVGQYSPAGDSPYGAADMAGNVWEWCSTLYRGYPYRPDDGREDLEAEGKRVWRGGSWRYSLKLARCACRDEGVPDYRCESVGFRVVVSSGSP